MKGMVAGLTTAACGLWVLAVSLLVMQTVTDLSLKVSAWALMVGLWACVASGWALLLNERTRVETIAEMAAMAVLEHQGLRSVDD